RALSGGMKMRASLARSLSLDPSVFLFDEPFGALDEITRERLLDETSALHRAKGFTGLFITHSIPEAVFLSDRVVMMSARPGQIAAEFAIDLPHPRTADMRLTPEFASGCATISKALRETILSTGDKK
ncbi:MAG: ABC transporter ATP-binding protein, partial [Marinomonas sp.]